MKEMNWKSKRIKNRDSRKKKEKQKKHKNT